ncbi:MAG: tetratricopeptide repeat protein [Candidatus Moraniibacteriota bacterium]
MRDVITPGNRPKITHDRIIKESVRGHRKYRPRKIILVFLALVFLAAAFLVWRKYFSHSSSSSPLQSGLNNLEQGNFDEASENFQKAVKADRGDTRALDSLALSQYNQKQYAEALENIDKSLAINSENYLAYNNKANIYRDQKDFAKAEENYRKAIELNSKYDAAYSNLAIMLLDEGKRDEAKKVVADGLSAIPDNENLKNIRGILGE